MSIGEGIAYATFWFCLCVGFVAYLKFRRPKHRHVWKEFGIENVLYRDNAIAGRVSYCKCEECGERKSFYMPVGG